VVSHLPRAGLGADVGSRARGGLSSGQAAGGCSLAGPEPCGWVVQDLPSRWYENADSSRGVLYNGQEGNTGISLLF